MSNLLPDRLPCGHHVSDWVDIPDSEYEPFCERCTSNAKAEVLLRRVQQLEQLCIDSGVQVPTYPVTDIGERLKRKPVQQTPDITDELNAAEYARFPLPDPPPVDRSNRCTIGGMDPNTDEHRELKPNGQQRDYVVLCEEERAKGFVRPVRRSYKHVGIPGPKYPLRDLDPETEAHHIKSGYVKFEVYPESESPKTGRFWTQEQLDKIGKGCRTVTTMSLALAETYARDPHFYSGTFCSGCGAHFPVGETGEFVWEPDGSMVGT